MAAIETKRGALESSRRASTRGGTAMRDGASSSILGDDLLTIAQAVERHDVSPAALYAAIQRGTVRATRSRVVAAEDVARLAASLARRREQARERTLRALEAAAAWPEHASARGPSRPDRQGGLTKDRLAALFGTTPSLIQAARFVLRDPDLVERVQRGELALTHAAADLRRERSR